ncbi:Na(+)/H(+) antiporter subunit C [Paenibacillus oenotherae]|uniref:Na(+)/H(+) antiporter subunit C n=1 Tax=Paenibacillus oenotherae TaxID=1435645 RepID=A0ABS7D631_9BACL|nr:Na(+)/H(+) antiporter subunit C [Paenibacillus oenotherae]MBW7475400.1 Na(+)/H(+) antiporter subunit C [Paenibacillus oenotherae]
MELYMSLAIGVLFTVGVYLILSKSLLRIILGTSLMTHGIHLLLLTMSRLKRGAPPLLGEEAEAYGDPLPQALILTSIVISFGVTSLYLILAYKAYRKLGTDNMELLRGEEDE